MSDPGGAPLPFVVARKAAVISFRSYPLANDLPHLPKFQSAAIDCLSELRGSFDVYVTPGMRAGAIEVSIGRTGDAALAACVFEAATPAEELRSRLAAVVARIADTGA
ncbi:MAG: hypothetical protein DMF78_23090 [Acidobacteria bacterium]|nr:MAG: hypothetical protein DMF78_23090 [Acidobacteriota bacterium]